MFEARDGAEPSVWGSRERAPRAPARQSDAGGPSFPPGMRRTAGMRSAPAPAGRCAHLPLAVGLHQLAERRVPLDLELHDGAILPSHLQVDVVVLCLHSFLGKTGRAEISARRGPTLPPCSACDPPRARRAPAAPRRAYLGLLLRHGGRTGPGGPVGAGRARPARCLPPGSRSRRQPPARERAQPRPRRPAPATPRPDWPPGRSRERRVGGMSDRAQLGASRKCVTERRKRRERGAGLRGREGRSTAARARSYGAPLRVYRKYHAALRSRVRGCRVRAFCERHVCRQPHSAVSQNGISGCYRIHAALLCTANPL